MPDQETLWGGDWTERKLDAVEAYLDAYTTALKKQRFRLVYIDAFAGTGYRERPVLGTEAPLFDESAQKDARALRDGSAVRALKIEPAFDEYLFIERSPSRFNRLTELEEDFPELADRMKFVREDCNAYLPRICDERDWRRQRAVLFLDPFGMQVDWSTMEAVAWTEAIDVLILFPLSAVNRLLPRNGEIPPGWADRLTAFFGTLQWREDFFTTQVMPLFGEETEAKTADYASIGAYFLDRLNSIFAGVAENPKVLDDSQDRPLFLLCFAMANPAPNAQEVALRIAEHILRDQ